MAAQPDSASHITPEDYLAMERQADHKSEYCNGQIFAMVGASRPHNLIVVNIAAELRRQLKGRSCEAYVNDMRVRVNTTDGNEASMGGHSTCPGGDFRRWWCLPGWWVSARSGLTHPTREDGFQGRRFITSSAWPPGTAPPDRPRSPPGARWPAVVVADRPPSPVPGYRPRCSSAPTARWECR